MNNPTLLADTSVSETYTYRFSCEDLNAPGTRVSNHIEFTINDPSSVSSSLSLVSDALVSTTEYFTMDGTIPYVSIEPLYNNIKDDDKHCGYRIYVS